MDEKRNELKKIIMDTRTLPTLPGIINKLNTLSENEKSSVQRNLLHRINPKSKAQRVLLYRTNGKSMVQQNLLHRRNEKDTVQKKRLRLINGKYCRRKSCLKVKKSTIFAKLVQYWQN